MDSDKEERGDAIDLAIDRTLVAQQRAAAEIESEGIPDPTTTKTVVRRADDVVELVEEDDDDEDDEPEGPWAEPPSPSGA